MFSRLLFKLHIINNLTIQRDRSGRAMVTLHRTDDKSSDIRPDIQPFTHGLNMDIRAAQHSDHVYIVNGVDPLVRANLTSSKGKDV